MSGIWNEREASLVLYELVELSCAYAQARLVLLSVDDGNLLIPRHLQTTARKPRYATKARLQAGGMTGFRLSRDS